MASTLLSKPEKERQKILHEKCQSMLNDMLRDEDNKYCIDCDAKGPRWASWNVGVFLCIRCAGIHRNLGVHISKVKSVNLDTWTPEQVVSMTNMGNSRGRAVYEANLPDAFRRPQTDVALENFIRAKYEHKKYIAKEFVPSPVVKVDWTLEIDEMIASKGKKKIANANSQILFPKLTIPPGDSQQKVNNQKKQVTKSAEQQPQPPPVTNISNQPLSIVEKDKVPESNPLFDLSDIVMPSNQSFQQPSELMLQELTLTEPEQQKLTKESILSLYQNNATTNTNQNPFFNQFQQPPPTVQQQQQQNLAQFGLFNQASPQPPPPPTSIQPNYYYKN